MDSELKKSDMEINERLDYKWIEFSVSKKDYHQLKIKNDISINAWMWK